MVRVVFGRAIRDFDEKSSRALDQQWERVMRRDQMRIDRESQHAKASLEVVLPDGRVPFDELLAAPDVVHEDVQPIVVSADAFDQLSNRVALEMIDLKRDAFAPGL